MSPFAIADAVTLRGKNDAVNGGSIFNLTTHGLLLVGGHRRSRIIFGRVHRAIKMQRPA